MIIRDSQISPYKSISNMSPSRCESIPRCEAVLKCHPSLTSANRKTRLESRPERSSHGLTLLQALEPRFWVRNLVDLKRQISLFARINKKWKHFINYRAFIPLLGKTGNRQRIKRATRKQEITQTTTSQSSYHHQFSTHLLLQPPSNTTSPTHSQNRPSLSY